jgi:hypothetical protein
MTWTYSVYMFIAHWNDYIRHIYINTSDAIPNNLVSFCIIVYYSVNISEQINEDRRRTPIDVICPFYIWKGRFFVFKWIELK